MREIRVSLHEGKMRIDFISDKSILWTWHGFVLPERIDEWICNWILGGKPPS